MVNPRYRPTIANSRKPVGSKSKTIHPEGFDQFKVDFVFPTKENILDHILKVN